MIALLNEDIRNNWKTDIIGHAQELTALSTTGYSAWTVKYSESFGVAIPYSGADEVNETFANVRIYSSSISFNDGPPQRALILCSENRDIKAPFSKLCEGFIDPGKNGAQRSEIISSPVSWWKEWKELLGNKNIDDRIYDTLGELCVLKKIIESGEDCDWNGPNGASYDIETNRRFVEVKSTIIRDKKEITISNQFQLEPPNKPLNLVLCQFEPTVQSGVSINGIIDEFSAIGYSTEVLNERLSSLGFEKGRSARNRKFILHGMLEYKVDPDFPRITPQSFVGGIMPAGITKITYTVDLSGMTARSMLQGEEKNVSEI